MHVFPWSRIGFVFLSVLPIAGGSPVAAQIGQTRMDFQRIQPHPYVHALGNATVAASGYAGAIGVNPATIGTPDAIRVGTNANLRRGPVYSSPWLRSWFVDNWITAPSVTVKQGPWAAGVQFKHYSQGQSEIRTPDGRVQRTVSHYEQSVKLAGAYDLSTRFTVGAGINFLRSRIAVGMGEEAKVHPTVDVGAFYETSIDKEVLTLRPALGLSITDFGANITYENLPGDYGTPTTFRLGGRLEATSASSLYGRPEWRVGAYGAFSNVLVNGEWVEENMSRYFDADGPFKSLATGWTSTTGAWGAQSGGERLGPWERLTKHVGMEMSVLDILSARVGRYHESENNGDRQYTALGFGLDAYYVALDASWTLGNENPYQDYSYGRLTVRIPLSESPRNFWPDIWPGD